MTCGLVLGSAQSLPLGKELSNTGVPVTQVRKRIGLGDQLRLEPGTPGRYSQKGRWLPEADRDISLGQG